MTNHSSLEELLTRHPGLEEMNMLLSEKNLLPEELRTVELHKFIVESVAELPNEQVPESLMQQLYTIEEQPYKDFAKDIIGDTKQLLPYTVGIVITIVLLYSELIGTETVVRNIIILSAGCGFVFYQMFKSKFFVV